MCERGKDMAGFFAGLVLKTGELCVRSAYRYIARKTQKNDYLCYDVSTLIDSYSDEDQRIGDQLPYVEELNLLGDTWEEFAGNVETIKVVGVKGSFKLANKPPSGLSSFQNEVLARFKKEGRLGVDESVVRLNSFDRSKMTLAVQKCKYTDGLQSNYAMDLEGQLKLGKSVVSLRTLLQSKYQKMLPPLKDKRLSNAIGIAVVVFCKTEEGDIVPYLPRRASPTILGEILGVKGKLALFPKGGYHCTASGETSWRGGKLSFYEVFTRDICRELEEEVGILEQDLEWIYPISLCREFLRGGKPQIFFAGFTKLPPKAINTRRRAAIEKQKELGRQEVEDEALVVQDPDQLYVDLGKHGTIEAVVNMRYAQDCARLADRFGKFK